MEFARELTLQEANLQPPPGRFPWDGVRVLAMIASLTALEFRRKTTNFSRGEFSMTMGRDVLRCNIFLTILIVAMRCSISLSATIAPNWLSPISGEWTDITKWSSNPVYPDNGQPGATDVYTVLIDASGNAYSVSLFDSVAVDSVTLDSPDAKLELGSSRLKTPLIDVAQGTLLLGVERSGIPSTETQIVGATITGAGAVEVHTQSTLVVPVFDGVTLDTQIEIPGSSTSPPRTTLKVRNGLELTSNGVFTLQGGALVDIDGDQLLQGAGQIRLGGGTPAGSHVSMQFLPNTTLTVSQDTAIRNASRAGSIGLISGTLTANDNVGLVNHGLLSGEGDGTRLGLMNAVTDTGVTFENFGTVQATDGGEVVVGGEWRNHGTFRLREDSGLILSGVFSASDIGTIDRVGGTLYLAGRLQNAGQTITANASTGDIQLGYPSFGFAEPSRIEGGRIEAADGAAWKVNTVGLNNVTIATDMLMEEDSHLYVNGDLHFDGGTLNISSMFDNQKPTRFRFDVDPGSQSITGNGTIRFLQGRVGTINVGDDLTIESGIHIETLQDEAKTIGQSLTTAASMRIAPEARFTFSNQELVQQGNIEVEGLLIIGRDVLSGVDRTDWVNEGTIRLRPSSTLRINGNTSLDGLGDIVDDGAAFVRFAGGLDLEGGTFDAHTLGFRKPVLLRDGYFSNGTMKSRNIRSGSETAVLGGAFLDNITLVDSYNLTSGGANSGFLDATNTLTFDNLTFVFDEATQLQFHGDTQRLEGIAQIRTKELVNTSGAVRIYGEQLVIGEGITIDNSLGTEVVLDFKESHATLIAAAPNKQFSIGDRGMPWTNHGLIRVEGGILVFEGNYSVEDIGKVAYQSGRVLSSGTLENEGSTLTLDQSTGAWEFAGSVQGGRLQIEEGLEATFRSVLLDDVSFTGRATGGAFVRGKLTLDQGMVFLVPGHSLNGEQVDLAGTGAIVLGGTPESTGIQRSFGTLLTVGPNVTISTGTAGGGVVSHPAGDVVNHGTLTAEHFGHTLRIAGDLQNFGTLRSQNRGSLVIATDEWINQGVIEVGPVARGFGGVRIESQRFENGIDGTITGHGVLQVTKASIINSGMISPGTGVGRLDILGSLQLTDTSTLLASVMNPLQTDLLSVSGDVLLAGELELDLLDLSSLEIGDSFTIITSSGGQVSGRFANAFEQLQVESAFFQVNYGDRAVSLTVLQVPEPGAVMIALLGIASLLHCRQRTFSCSQRC